MNSEPVTMSTANINKINQIRFFLQDREHIVDTKDVAPEMSLNAYIRQVLHLTGTKYMCYEGGCGSCIVVISKTDPDTQKQIYLAVNSCLMSVYSCHGWKVYTIEGIGNPLTDYHPIQKVLAQFNGTQCGFCSPGMVMNMYALFQSGKLTMQEVEDSFGGNICRCTGYRPILSAFKSLCKDASPDLLGLYPDIEDINKPCDRANCAKHCQKVCYQIPQDAVYHLALNSTWIKIYTLEDLLNNMRKFADVKIKLVAGNTAKGVFKNYGGQFDVYIDISAVSELKGIKIEADRLIVGASNTLNDVMTSFYEISQENSMFSHLKQLADHIDLIANVPVRNIGTLAGNLMMKHDNNDFPSDIFLIFATIGAVLTIVDISGKEITSTLEDFIKSDMKDKVLKCLTVPGIGSNVNFQSYKIMSRAQNTHAEVNAGFLFNFNNDKTVLNEITIIYGNINPDFVHATATENLLKGKNLFDNATLQNAFDALSGEIVPNDIPPDPSPEFRKQLAIALFYKAVLSVAPDGKVSPLNKSGGTILERPISSGVQDFETNESLYPLTQAIPKLEAIAQTSGQAEYIRDIPDLPFQLFAMFVLSDAAPNSIVKNIDTSEALKLEGVVAFYEHNDIPGENNFMPKEVGSIEVEEIFCSGRVLYYQQPVGVIVGNSEQVLRQAAQLVKITYDHATEKPLLTVREILKAGRHDRIHEEMTIVPKRKGDDVKHVIKGSFDIYQQYHFHMETQCCNVVPNEDGLDVFPSSQWMDIVQIAIANMLKLPNNKVNIKIRRCGGGFGAKISRNTLIACATALASWKLKKPVRMNMSLSTNMGVIGKRFPLSTDYEVAVNDKGVVQYMNSTHYTDLGIVSNESGLGLTVPLFMGNYDSDTFLMHMNSARTDTHTNTWTRSPGSTEGLAAIEAIMEHVAYSINLDPLDLRIANFKKDSPLMKYVDDLKTWAEVDKRKLEIANFNKANRWKKKGFSIVPMTYQFDIAGPYSTMVSIYHGDASVAISHGGIEIGQGINTKVAQVCAYKFGIPLEKVAVLPSSSFISPNCTATGGSITSEAVCYGAISACDQLLARMEPYRKEMKNPTWEQLVKKCFEESVDLSAIGSYTPKSPNVSEYLIYGIVATEVLVDILTGQHIITRVDLIEDAGQSMSPDIDIGQVEGAFVMGIGYYTTEKIVYNSDGKILTNNTWTYCPPGPKDIPVDFRVKFPKNNYNPVGVLKSKAIAEPPLCLSISVPLAIRNAVASARTDANNTNAKWYPIDGTTTGENIFMNSLNEYRQYTL